MDFALSPEERLFLENVRSAVERHVAPHWVDLDSGRYPLERVIAGLAQSGLAGFTIGEEYGGQGGSFLMAALAAEEIAYGDPSMSSAVYFLLECTWPYMVQLYGSDEAKRQVLPEVAAGRAFIGIASTEPHGGSDVAGTTTLAREGSDGWRLYGEKSMVTGVSTALGLPYGGGFVTVARTGPQEDRHRAITLFLAMVKEGGEVRAGFRHRDHEELGRGGIPTAYLYLEGLEVPRQHVVGPLNGGFKVAMEGFNLARAIIGAASIGVARWLLDRAREWVKERKVFDRPIAAYQGISFKYAELYARLEATRLAVYRAAWLADKYYREAAPGYTVHDVAAAGAVAKYLAVGLAVEVGLEVMKWFGGASYFRELPVNRALLGALSYYVGAEGAENIMKLIIARNLLGREVD